MATKKAAPTAGSKKASSTRTASTPRSTTTSKGRSGAKSKTATKKTATTRKTPAKSTTAKRRVIMPPAVAKAPPSVRAAYKAGAKDAEGMGPQMKAGWAQVRATHDQELGKDGKKKWVKKG